MKPLALVGLFIILLPAVLFGQQEGPNYAGSTENQPYATCTSCAGAIWDSTENISAIDGQFSSVQLDPYLNCFQSSCFRSRYLTCYNYGFNIPQNAIINGITVNVAGLPDANGSVRDCTIVLRRDNSLNLFGNNMAVQAPWNMNQPDHSYGGSTELWGLTWAPADINAFDFGVYIKLYNTGGSMHTVDIDAVVITVNYSIGMSVYSVSSTPKPLTVYHDAANTLLQVNMNFAADENARVRIVDMLGRTCISEPAGTTDGRLEISTAMLSPGVYTCMVESKGSVYSEKFVR